MRSTNMTKLLNKIERRLGTQPLNLPDHLKKDQWADIIREDTLDTFSRYFPHKLLYIIDTKNDISRDGKFYHINEDIFPDDVEVYGVRDLTMQNLAKFTDINNGYYDSIYNNYGFEDIVMGQMNADMNSVYNSGIFVDFIYPNKITIDGVTGIDLAKRLPKVEVELLVKHANNLSTISPTKMEEFERLAISDIKMFLYNSLKHYNNIETIFANIDLMIDDWSNAESDRDSIIDVFKESYVSAANDNQPMMYTV